MNARSVKLLQTRLNGFFSNRIVYHSIIWLVYILFFSILQIGKGNFMYYFSNELVKVFFFAIAVYFNLYYLIPNYLSEKKFLTYSLYMILLVVIVSPLQVFFLYLKLSNHPLQQLELVEKQQVLFILTFLIVGISTILKIISEWVRHERVKKEAEIERAILTKQRMQAELRFLKSQINPHFLFNTLNNLYALTLKKDDKAPEIVIKLSEMMRYMLYECNEKRVPLRKEVNYIKNYLDLERLRQGNNVEISFEIKGEISDQQIAPLMFIPFLENSFKHGLSNTLSTGFVHILLDLNQSGLQFFIRNSKPGMPGSPRQVGGIGLVNIRQQLDLLYPGHHNLSIQDDPNTYTINLKIDL